MSREQDKWDAGERDYKAARDMPNTTVTDRTNAMTQYAAYDHLAIYAIGDTPEAAIAKARDDSREPDSTFDTAKIDDVDAAEIENGGFDGHQDYFEVKNDRIVLDLKRNR